MTISSSTSVCVSVNDDLYLFFHVQVYKTSMCLGRQTGNFLMPGKVFLNINSVIVQFI